MNWMQSWATIHCTVKIKYFMLLLFCLVFNMTCFCYTQCKTALDLLPGMKLNMLEVVSALLGKMLDHWKRPTCGKTLQFCFEISNKKIRKKTQKCINCRQLSEENRGAVISIPVMWSNKRPYLCPQSPALPGVSREFVHGRAFLPCCSLTQEGKNGLCFQLMFSARWLCGWRGYLCTLEMRCIIFGNLLLQSGCSMQGSTSLKWLSHGVTHTQAA